MPRAAAAIAMVVVGFAAACSLQATPTQAPTPSSPPPAGQAPPSPTAVLSPASRETERFYLVPEASEARFRVREQLAERPLPSDAVGTTRNISGSLVLGADGRVVQEGSKFVVNLESLRTDNSRRDNFIQRNTLETGRFPYAEFVPTEVQGLSFPVPTSGEATFQIVGDLTIHGVTKPATWQVRAQFAERQVSGTATTSVTFRDFGMEPPRVMMVLSVEESIRLEVDFQMAREL